MITLTTAGAVSQSTEEILEAVRADWTAIFGEDLNLAPETPQGQIITALTAIIAEKDAEILNLYSQIDPRTADGAMQDGVAQIYFIERQAASPTYVNVLCKGIAGTYIAGMADSAGGAVIRSDSGDLFICSEGGNIGSDGSVTLRFQSVETGAVPANAGALTTIHKAVSGWDSCINETAGALGRVEETGAEFEARRRQSVEKNATGSVGAIYANVAAVEDVIDCRVFENTGSTVKYIGSVPLNPHSVYVSVEGGADAEIAQAIYSRKSAGCDMNGNTSYTVTDIASGAEYKILFERPAAKAFTVSVSVLNSTADADASGTIKDIIYANFYGTDGTERARIGGTVYASRFYPPLINAGYDPVSIKVNGADYDSCEINQIPALSEDDITVSFI